VRLSTDDAYITILDDEETAWLGRCQDLSSSYLLDIPWLSLGSVCGTDSVMRRVMPQPIVARHVGWASSLGSWLFSASCTPTTYGTPPVGQFAWRHHCVPACCPNIALLSQKKEKAKWRNAHFIAHLLPWLIYTPSEGRLSCCTIHAILTGA